MSKPYHIRLETPRGAPYCIPSCAPLPLKSIEFRANWFGQSSMRIGILRVRNQGQSLHSWRNGWVAQDSRRDLSVLSV